MPAKSPTTIAAMVAGFRPLGDTLRELAVVPVVFVEGFESIFGMAAMAGEDVVTLGGAMDSVEGTVHRIFRGLPQRSAFPDRNSVFWWSKAKDSGIGPVRLLNERSTVVFPGICFANDGGIVPEILL